MIEALKKLIVKHGGTYDRYDNTELDLLRALCNTLGLEYTKYMDTSELFNIVFSSDKLGGELPPEEEAPVTGGDSILNNIPKNLVLDKTYLYKASNGKDIYYSTNSSSSLGLWHRDLETGIETKIYESGYRWQFFFENTAGDIYVGGSNSYTNNLLYLNGDQPAVPVYKYSSYNWRYFFEYSKGNTYASYYSNNSGGVFLLHKHLYEEVGRFSAAEAFFEDSKGNVYISDCGDYRASKLCVLTSPTTTKTLWTGRIEGTSSAYYVRYFYEDLKTDTLYAYYSATLVVTPTGVTNIGYSDNYQLYRNSLIKDNLGNAYIYLDGTSSYSLGFDKLTPTQAVQAYTVGNAYKEITRDSEGRIYMYSKDSASPGILLIYNGEITQIYDKGYYWDRTYTDSAGNIYVSSSKYTEDTKGLLLLKEGTYKILEDTYCNYNIFLEDSKGVVYTSSSASSSTNGISSAKGLLRIKNNEAVFIYTLGFSWQSFVENVDGSIYIACYYNYGVLHIVGDTYTALDTSVSGYIQRINDTIILASTYALVESSQVRVIENGVIKGPYYIIPLTKGA